MSFSPRIPPPPHDPGPFFGTPLDHALARFAAAASLADSVDPVTSELVRLRCAEYHDCRLCRSLRTDAALMEGYVEDMEPTPAQAAALAFADALIVDPAGISPEVCADLRRHFSDEQIAELGLKIVKWSFQKIVVSLRLDDAPREGLSMLSMDADGNAVIGGALA